MFWCGANPKHSNKTKGAHVILCRGPRHVVPFCLWHSNTFASRWIVWINNPFYTRPRDTPGTCLRLYSAHKHLECTIKGQIVSICDSMTPSKTEQGTTVVHVFLIFIFFLQLHSTTTISALHCSHERHNHHIWISALHCCNKTSNPMDVGAAKTIGSIVFAFLKF